MRNKNYLIATKNRLLNKKLYKNAAIVTALQNNEIEKAEYLVHKSFEKHPKSVKMRKLEEEEPILDAIKQTGEQQIEKLEELINKPDNIAIQNFLTQKAIEEKRPMEVDINSGLKDPIGKDKRFPFPYDVLVQLENLGSDQQIKVLNGLLKEIDLERQMFYNKIRRKASTALQVGKYQNSRDMLFHYKQRIQIITSYFHPKQPPKIKRRTKYAEVGEGDEVPGLGFCPVNYPKIVKGKGFRPVNYPKLVTVIGSGCRIIPYPQKKGGSILTTMGEVIEKFKILVGEVEAGNSSQKLKNELSEISTYLLKHKKISKTEFQKLLGLVLR